jgi:hypothetical protein
MLSPTPSRVRFALVGVLAILVVAFTQSDVWSQPGRPPRPPGSGIAGRPPGGITGMPGGFTGMPGGGIAGFPGGITGMPGGFTGMPGGIAGMPGGLGGGMSQQVWKCTKCRGVLGYGPHDPGQSICPHCGARLVGTTIMPGGGIGGGGFPTAPSMPSAPFNSGVPPGFNGGGPPPGNAPPANSGALELPTNPGFPTTTPAPGSDPPAPSVNPPSSGSNGSSDVIHKSSPSSSGQTAKVLKILGIVVASLVLLVVIGMMIAISKNGRGRPVKRARRLSRFDEDDYDD